MVPKAVASITYVPKIDSKDMRKHGLHYPLL